MLGCLFYERIGVYMDFLKDVNKKKQFLFTYVTFGINGMLALSIGSLLPFIRDAKGLDYAFSGMIVSLHSVVKFFLCTFLSDHYFI